MIDRTGFIIGTLFWLYIILKYSFGEAAEFKEKPHDESVKFAFNALRWIVT